MKLKDYLYFNEISITDFAKKIGISRTHMSMVVNGARDPGKFLLENILLKTKGQVTTEDFSLSSK